MTKKIDVGCCLCDADYVINHDLEPPYRLDFCAFCGENIGDDDMEIDDYGDEDPDDD